MAFIASSWKSNSLTFLENIRKCIFQRKKGVGKESPNLFLLCLFGIFALFTGLNQKADTCKYFFLDKKVKPTLGQYFQNCIFQCKKVKKSNLFSLFIYIYLPFLQYLIMRLILASIFFLTKQWNQILAKFSKSVKSPKKLPFFNAKRE